MKKLFLILLSLLVLVSCSQTPFVPKKIETEITIHKPFDEVWVQTVEWFAKNNFTIGVIEKESGIVSVNREFYAEGFSYMDCKEDGNFGIRLTDPAIKFNVFVKKIGTLQTVVNLNSVYTASTIEYNYGNPEKIYIAKCYSNGRLEKSYFDYVR